jgi:hypothetical protein
VYEARRAGALKGDSSSPIFQLGVNHDQSCIVCPPRIQARQGEGTRPIAQALGANAPKLLAKAPSIERIDVLGAKLPS